MTQDLRVDISECRHADDIPIESFDDWEGAALGIRALRKLGDGRLRSGLLALPAGWEGAVAPGDAARLQVFVRSGTLELGDRQLGADAFIVIGPGQAVLVAARSACDLLVIFDRHVPNGPDAGLVVIENAFGIEPFTPVIGGKRLEGFERRVLWLDPATGADTRLLRVPAGFRGGGPNWHPVEEEIFCLEGDIAPDETRPMRAGSFLWNPARSIHGFNEHTIDGCLLLEWHDGPWALTPAPGATRPERL